MIVGIGKKCFHATVTALRYMMWNTLCHHPCHSYHIYKLSQPFIPSIVKYGVPKIRRHRFSALNNVLATGIMTSRKKMLRRRPGRNRKGNVLGQEFVKTFKVAVYWLRGFHCQYQCNRKIKIPLFITISLLSTYLTKQSSIKRDHSSISTRLPWGRSKASMIVMVDPPCCF